MPRLSIIIPCYYNEENIPITSKRLLENESNFPADVEFEYVMVDDGSKDGTYQALKKFQSENPGKVVIIKLGRQGCMVARDGEFTAVAAHRVRAVDTTAAGDTFSGGLAAELSRGQELLTAVRFANAAAALCVTKPGAISSIPTRAAVLDFLRDQ